MVKITGQYELAEPLRSVSSVPADGYCMLMRTPKVLYTTSAQLGIEGGRFDRWEVLYLFVRK